MNNFIFEVTDESQLKPVSDFIARFYNLPLPLHKSGYFRDGILFWIYNNYIPSKGGRLPAYMGLDHEGDPFHNPCTPTAFNDYFSDCLLLPIDVAIHPELYPEYYI